MRAIQKGTEPQELREYREPLYAYFDGLPLDVKNLIREQLLCEQGYLCAYCMQFIEKNAMKIDHWHSKRRYQHEQLDYDNMLGVCKGKEGGRPTHQTCDTRKGDRDLKYNPADPAHEIEKCVRYLPNGKIESDETDFNAELNDVLNLNHSRLITYRRGVSALVADKLNPITGPHSASEIQRLLDEWALPNRDGKLREYCGVAVYLLNKRLKRQAPTS